MQLGTDDVEAFLNDLVVERRLSASSQNQALNALVFLYRHVLEDAIPSDHLGRITLLRSKRANRVPTVLSTDEVALLLGAMLGMCGVAWRTYGVGCSGRLFRCV